MAKRRKATKKASKTTRGRKRAGATKRARTTKRAAARKSTRRPAKKAARKPAAAAKKQMAPKPRAPKPVAVPDVMPHTAAPAITEGVPVPAEAGTLKVG
jgi:hypothetical protein